MKFRFRNLLAALSAALVLAAVPAVAALQSTDGTDTNSTAASSDTAASEDKTALQQRLQKYKDDFKEKLSTTEENHLKLRCKAAQGIIASTDERAGKYAPERVQAYEELQTVLTKLIAKLKTKGIDTTTLEQEQTVLAGKAAQIKTDFSSYKQQLGDLKDMDCASDPTAFKAALESARTARTKLAGEIADIKSYVKNTIKPTLQQLRQQIESKDASTSQGGNQ